VACCSTAATEALQCSGGQYHHRTSFQYLALVVCDLAGWFLEHDGNRRPGDLHLTSTAIIYGWMYNNTNGSLLIAMIAHLGHNLAVTLMPTPPDGGQQHLINALAYRGGRPRNPDDASNWPSVLKKEHCDQIN